ncbi:Methylmalonyl-CoA mutase small subunit [Rubripirellula obstinata]|uniref:methylmalonyl-CoA mutase n=1 Tax=Rubripirellula obstinata TaxID=406547 RepID=A0A5B1CRT4_9BACT|nr:methylmalonyl-CoA mutase family protein [Rubripirellula obstinata]KAA1262360.1 Methylmalonyl-CoA mutase small subunit [Rubripirellula obstinata]
MTETSFKIADDFPPVDYQTWRESAESALGGVPFERKLVSHTYEGIDIQPVYTLADKLAGENPTGFPGSAPFVRGSRPLGHVLSGVDLRQENSHPDLKICNEAILADLQGGVTSLQLQFDRATRVGYDLTDSDATALVGDDGMMAYSLSDFETALEGVQLELVDLALDAGGSFIPAAATLAALWKEKKVTSDKARGAFNADPLKTLAAEGQLPVDAETAIADMANLAAWTAGNLPKVTAVGVDTSVYHDSGATAAEDIAFSMATALQYLRAMTDAGMSIDDAAKQILFRFSLGTHHFLAIAKLRAARQLWSRILEASGSSAVGMKIHARTGNRVMTQRDPYVNLLRNSVAVFAALTGGVDAITSLPFDHAAGLPNDFSRRIARNTVLILQEESHLHRVMDPAGGSWFLENLTSEMSEKAWAVFQEVEAQGGMLPALKSNFIADKIDSAYAPRAKDIARRKEGITGVSEFPNLQEESVQHPPPDIKSLKTAAVARHNVSANEDSAPEAPPAIQRGAEMMSACITMSQGGATLGMIGKAIGFEPGKVTINPIEAHAFAQPFEELRDASDAWMEKHGKRPQIFSANVGPVAHFNARAGYAKNFFEAGGFEVPENGGFPDADSVAAAFKESGLEVAVICSSDKLYADQAAAVASALKANGAKTVILAGHPGKNEEDWRAAGVDEFIYIKCDVLGTLRKLLRDQEVLAS